MNEKSNIWGERIISVIATLGVIAVLGFATVFGAKRIYYWATTAGKYELILLVSFEESSEDDFRMQQSKLDKPIRYETLQECFNMGRKAIQYERRLVARLGEEDVRIFKVKCAKHRRFWFDKNYYETSANTKID